MNLLQEQIEYYRARAGEYDEWWLRHGRYDRGPEENARWFAEAEQLRQALEDWQPPPEWGVGAHAKHLRNLYVYFWRWAAWKVFGGDPYRGGTDVSEAKWTERRGVVCFITVSGS